ncbi:MAG: redoxin domain-containing protein [Bacteroidota bacterium]
MNKWLCWLYCLYFMGSAYAQTIPLKDFKDRPFLLNEKPAGKARVYYFLSPECPLCQSYSLTIRKLHEDFAKQNIEMIGIIPGTDFSAAEILAFEMKYKIPIRMYRDEQFALVGKYEATITPEVVVVNKEGAVMYQGRIDNWAYELGKKRKVITEHNLRDALSAIINNQPVKVKQTKAVGCFIE